VIAITYCGIWNERAYDVAWIKLLRRTLNRAGLAQVKLVAADEVRTWTIADQMAADPELRDAVQVIGTHFPAEFSACQMLPGGGSCVAAVAPDGKDFSIVVETMGAKSQVANNHCRTGVSNSDSRKSVCSW
jgi:hypothetical protein